jgi:hypothetical protein
VNGNTRADPIIYDITLSTATANVIEIKPNHAIPEIAACNLKIDAFWFRPSQVAGTEGTWVQIRTDSLSDILDLNYDKSPVNPTMTF